MSGDQGLGFKVKASGCAYQSLFKTQWKVFKFYIEGSTLTTRVYRCFDDKNLSLRSKIRKQTPMLDFLLGSGY